MIMSKYANLVISIILSFPTLLLAKYQFGQRIQNHFKKISLLLFVLFFSLVTTSI